MCRHRNHAHRRASGRATHRLALASVVVSLRETNFPLAEREDYIGLALARANETPV